MAANRKSIEKAYDRFVKINFANRDELMEIPGIGERSSLAILHARYSSGNITKKTLRHIRRVKLTEEMMDLIDFSCNPRLCREYTEEEEVEVDHVYMQDRSSLSPETKKEGYWQRELADDRSPSYEPSHMIEKRYTCGGLQDHQPAMIDSRTVEYRRNQHDRLRFLRDRRSRTPDHWESENRSCFLQDQSRDRRKELYEDRPHFLRDNRVRSPDYRMEDCVHLTDQQKEVYEEDRARFLHKDRTRMPYHQTESDKVDRSRFLRDCAQPPDYQIEREEETALTNTVLHQGGPSKSPQDERYVELLTSALADIRVQVEAVMTADCGPKYQREST